MTKPITAAERALMDAQRRRAVSLSNGYVRRLVRLRTKEAGRVLDLCTSFLDYSAWADCIRTNLTERAYLPSWYKGLIVNGGLPAVTTTARMLTGKAEALASGVFEAGLADYAERRVGSEIVTVSGTMKDTLIGILEKTVKEDMNIPVEKLTKVIMGDFAGHYATWQARRIAQTEVLNGLAEAGHQAAEALDIPYLKQWSVSGLGNSRETHKAMDGKTVESYEMFRLPDCEMAYPHDTMNGTVEEIVNCACTLIRRPKY